MTEAATILQIDPRDDVATAFVGLARRRVSGVVAADHVPHSAWAPGGGGARWR